MVAFRKLFPVLAVFALLLGATSAYAQGSGTPLQCIANSGVPPVVRAEGYTELVGDIVITCTGGNPAAPFFANFQLFLNTNITSRLLSATQSEALLMVDEPGVPRATGRTTGFCVAGAGNNSVALTTGDCATVPGETDTTFQTGYNTVFYAQRTQEGVGARENAIVWAGIPVVPPGSNRSRTFRITNVRANAAGLGASQTLIPTQIVAFVSVNPPGTLPIDNPQQVVGYVQQGLVFDVRNAVNDDGVSLGLDQCSDPPNGEFRPGGALTGTRTLATRGLFRFREGFQSAFKPRLETGQETANPGVVFNSESGFVRPALLGQAGQATSGTRLAVRFQNVPTNLRIFVGQTDLRFTPGTASSLSPFGAGAVSSDSYRVFLASTDANGATGFGVTGSTGFGTSQGTLGSTIAGAAGTGLIEIPIVNGTGLAVWEVFSANPSLNEDVLIPFGVGFTNANPTTNSTQVGLGTGQVIGNLAPFYAAGSNAERMQQSVLPIPRFVSRTDANNFVRVQACQTNLLFPYVTNWAGFDTGIAIANTSSDPFSDPQNRVQAGRCTLNYYGSLPNGQPLTTTREETNAEVRTGETITMVLSTGGSLGLRGNANMQGYIIAQCNFRYAHGFAFITDGPIGQARVAEGYLALVLDGPDSSGRLRGNSTGESRGH